MAPELKIYCLYGVGRDSERGYVYAKASSIPSLPKISDLLTSSSEKTARMHPTVAKSKTSTTNEKTKSEADHKNQPERSEEEDEDDVEANQEDVDETSSSSPESPSSSNEDSSTRPIGARSPTIPLFAINTSYHLPEARIRSGVKLADGDGTVPLVSLGYMCIDGWKQKRWNPAGLSVITREYRDLNESLAILRSSTSVDHVDIMGNSDMIRDILYIACRRTNSHKKHPNSTTTNVPDKDNDKRDGGKSDEEVYEEVKDESKEDQISSSSNSNSGGDASDPLSHPLGELTWTEVTERVYSRIRPIAQRLHHRWEKRTGHELEEADKPPPLNPHTQKHDVEEIETATDSDTGSKPVKLNFDWTAEDEARLHELIVRKKQADRLKMEAAAAVKKSNPSSSSSTSSSPSWTSSPPPDQPSTDSFLERFHDRFHELESHLRDVMDSASAAVLGVNSNEQAKRREEEEIEQQLERRAQHRTVQTTKHKQQ